VLPSGGAMGTKPQQQLQRAAEAGEHGLFADWQPSWRNAAASGNSRAARAGQDERTPLLEEQLAVLQREHNELRQAIFAAAQAQRRLCAPRQARRGRFEIASEIFPVRHLSGDLDRKSTRLNSSHGSISYAVFCLKKKTRHNY